MNDPQPTQRELEEMLRKKAEEAEKHRRELEKEYLEKNKEKKDDHSNSR